MKVANSRFAPNFGAAGDFTDSVLLDLQLKAEEMWADGKYTDNLKPHADAAILQLQKQTARFVEFDTPDKDRTANVVWLKMCGGAVTELDRTTDICTISGAEAEVDTLPYEMDIDFKWNFSVDAEKARTNAYGIEEVIAKKIMEADKKMSESWATRLMTKYKAFAGPNIPVIDGSSVPFTWDAGNTTSNIAAASYNIDIVANLIQQMILNDVDGGYYLNAGQLFQPWMNAGLNSANFDGKGNDARRTQIDMNFDQFSFKRAALTEDMFLLSNSAVAMKTHNRYGIAPQYIGGSINQTRYKVKSNILPNTYWDVIYQLSCSGGKDIHTWQFMTRGGIWLNPTPCPTTIEGSDYTPTGVYSFTKVA